MNLLDKVPAPIRHVLIVFGATFLGADVQAVISAGGVTGVDWPTVLVAAVNSAAVATATAVAALWLTPLTRQYGIGSSSAGGDVR